MLRCVQCGCSRFDPQGYRCALCGGPHGPRHEQCHVSEETKAKLLAHTEELTRFGVTLEEVHPVYKWSAGDTIATVSLAIQVAEVLDPGILRRLLLFLHDLAIPKVDILRLRLEEPEIIDEILNSIEKPQTASRSHAS